MSVRDGMGLEVLFRLRELARFEFEIGRSM